MVGYSGLEAIMTTPVCAICHKKYKEEDWDSLDETKQWFGTNMFVMKKKFFSGKEYVKAIRVALCYDCMFAIEHMRKGEKWVKK